MAPTSASRAYASFALPPASQPLALITGDAGDNTLTGMSDADTIDGLGGNDRIEGRGGVDTLNGGEGNDVISYYLSNAVDGGGGDDLIVNSFVSGGTWAGGTGDDTIDFSNDAFDATINLAAASFLILGARFSGFENVIGSQGSERIAGTAGDNLLDGQAGDDSITGGDGYDTLNGGAGNDRITDGGDNVVNGGEGDDVIKNTNVDGGIWSGGNGTDKIDFTGNNFGAITIDLNASSFIINGAGFRGFEGIVGSAGNERIIGTAGANWLDGGAGIDTLIGGLGNDTYVIDNSRDQIVEAANGGIDLVYTTVSRSLSDNLEHLTLLGTGNIDGNGNGIANIVTGNAGNNVLRGYDGIDTLIGGAGNDTLAGGAGYDSMVGGAGNDFYYAEADSSFLRDAIFEQVNGGIDTIIIAGARNFTLDANVENLRMVYLGSTYAVGNELNNIITGGNFGGSVDGRHGNDTLYGGAGDDRLDGGNDSDVMIGGAGNDRYLIDSLNDQVIEAENGGIDEIVSVSSVTLGANIENATMSGIQQSLTGNELANYLSTSSFSDETGNVVTGLGGDDTIAANRRSDTLIGGMGNDTYILSGSSVDPSVVVENDGEGIDIYLVSNGAPTLAANVENLTVLDFSTGGGIGNALANIMTGSQYANALNGLDGDDLLNSNGGADTLLGGAGTDTLNGGADRDTLNGGTGQDIMSGGTENDLYYVDAAGDQVLETAAAGTDSVEAVINYVLPVNVEAFSISGTVTGLTLTGNDADNAFLGKNSVQNDVLRGLAGNDTFQLTTNGSGEFSNGVTIEGGEGSDILILSNSSNLRLAFTAVSESTGVGRDIINYIHFAPNLNNRFDFPTVPTSIAASVTIGGLDEGLFDVHLAQNIGAAQLGVGQALIFDPDQGDLANGPSFLIVDANGIAGYQAGGDYVVQINAALGTLTIDNFI